MVQYHYPGGVKTEVKSAKPKQQHIPNARPRTYEEVKARMAYLRSLRNQTRGDLDPNRPRTKAARIKAGKPIQVYKGVTAGNKGSSYKFPGKGGGRR